MERRSKQTRVTATVALFALLVTACGDVATDATNDQAYGVVEVPEPAAITDDAALDNAIAVPAADEPQHEYGTSLDEWTNLEQGTAPDHDDPAQDPNEGSLGYPEIVWDDLVPAGFSGDDIFARFEERFELLEPGSEEVNALYEEMDAEFDPNVVNDEIDGDQVRLVGFVAPLTYDGDIVTEFLLVPTFGACIHVPPPPPNQTVMVSSDVDNGLTLDESWGAVWVEGTIVVEEGTAELGASSYRITDVVTGPYTDF